MFTFSTATSMLVCAHKILRTSHPFTEGASLRPSSKLCSFKLVFIFPLPNLCYLIFTPFRRGRYLPRWLSVVWAWAAEHLLLRWPSYNSTQMPGCGWHHPRDDREGDVVGPITVHLQIVGWRVTACGGERSPLDGYANMRSWITWRCRGERWLSVHLPTSPSASLYI